MKILSKNTALIPQPRTVDTFPSGLVRVTQTYIGRTALKATHRAILAEGHDMPDGNSSPCLDGLKIFPEAQEKARDDGMTEYIVTAYGRVNSTGKKTLDSILETLPIRWIEMAYVNATDGLTLVSQLRNSSLQIVADFLIRQFVVPLGLQPDMVCPELLKMRRINGTDITSLAWTEFLPTGGDTHISSPVVTFIPALGIIEKISVSNFGNFNEFTLGYKTQVSVADFGNLTTVTPAAGATINNLLGYSNFSTGLALGNVYNIGGDVDILIGTTATVTRTGSSAYISGARLEFSWSQGLAAPSQPATAGASTKWWETEIIDTYTDSFGTHNIYGWVLKAPIVETFRWSVVNEFGRVSEFTESLTYVP